MDNFLVVIIALLVYAIVMPFVAWIVPGKAMNNASKYSQKVIPILGLKELMKSIIEAWRKKKP